MSGNPNENRSEGVRMELKYCEHCGGLFLRECGAGVVYCEKCQPKVAELPVPKKKPGRVILPVRRKTLLEDFSLGGGDDDGMELKAAAGGAA